MSEQARIETAVEMMIDNCEVLRARLAKYEDADGNPITTIAEQAREISSLRNIISECATACGAAVSVECSLEFMAMLPDEIRTVMAGKSREIERLHRDYDEACEDAMTVARQLAALKAKPSGMVRWPEADEIMQMAFEEGQPSEDASGYYFELEGFDLFIQRLMEEVARLNSPPVSAGEPVPATIGLTEYTYREALKTLREVLDPDDWMGEISMHAFIDAALSAPSHGEQVRHMVPQMVDFSPVPDDFRSQANGYRAGWNDCRDAISAAPSAGSQKEQG